MPGSTRKKGKCIQGEELQQKFTATVDNAVEPALISINSWSIWFPCHCQPPAIDQLSCRDFDPYPYRDV